jgi:cellulose synthase/poly-beta-1,6-N-acetylglucosamine synthase-like glycosyltransferase
MSPIRLLDSSLRQWADRVGFATSVAGVITLGWIQGVVLISIHFDAFVATVHFVVLSAALSCFSFAGGLFLSGVVFLIELVRDDTPAFAPRSGPTVEAIVPVYQDSDILHRSVESLLTSRYEDVQVSIVCEPDDTRSIRQARKFARHDRVSYYINNRYPGSKAGAVNYAAEVTDSLCLAVIDADERVDPAFISTAVSRLVTCDVVQGRTVPVPNGIIETAAYYESVLLGQITHRLLGLVTGFRMATSRAVVMNRAAFECVGGYDPVMLTEDFDFAVRCYRAGLAVQESFDHPSRIEAAHTPADWWGQRKRWMTGYAQVLHQRVVNLQWTMRSVLSLLIAAGSVVGNLLLLSMVSKVAVLAIVGAEIGLVPLVTAAAIALGIRGYDWWTGRVSGFGFGWILAPLVFPLYSLAGIKGTIEYLVSWNGEWYQVTKDG